MGNKTQSVVIFCAHLSRLLQLLTLSTQIYPANPSVAETRQQLRTLTEAHTQSLVYGKVAHYELADTPEGGWRLTRTVGTGRWAEDKAAEALAEYLPGGRLRVQYRVPVSRFVNSLIPILTLGAFGGWQHYLGDPIDTGLWVVYGLVGVGFYARVVYITRRRLGQLRADVERVLAM